MNISLKQLQAFLAVAKSGQFTRAADRLGMSQSSLSAAVQELEYALRVKLFDRHTRMVSLSSAGAEFLPVIERLLGDLKDAIDALHDQVNLGRGRVVIAAPGLQSALWLPQEIRGFKDHHPGVLVILHDVPEQSISGLVESGAADIGIVTSPESTRDLRSRRYQTDRFVVLMHANNPLAKKQSLTWDDVAGTPLIGLLARAPMRRSLELALSEKGIILEYAYEVSLPMTIVGMVQAQLGIAIVTTSMAPFADWARLVMRPVSNPIVQRELMLITSRQRSHSPATQALFERLSTSLGAS